MITLQSKYFSILSIKCQKNIFLDDSKSKYSLLINMIVKTFSAKKCRKVYFL